MLNRFCCIGRFSKELELKKTPNGKSVCTTTIAVNRNFKDQSGETKADFFPVVMWGNTAEKTAQFCNKGSLVGIDGRMETRSYEGQNGRVYLTEIIAESVQFLEPKKNEETQQYTPQQNNFSSTKKDASEIDWNDPDSLPF